MPDLDRLLKRYDEMGLGVSEAGDMIAALRARVEELEALHREVLGYIPRNDWKHGLYARIEAALSRKGA